MEPHKPGLIGGIERWRGAPGRPARWLQALGRRLVRPVAAAAVGGLVAWAFVTSQAAAGTVATLEVIGFSPDRSRLLAAFVVELAAVGAAALASGVLAASALVGLIVFAAAFRRTFLHETAAALQPGGPVGAFDPTGWALTVATLAVSAGALAGMIGVVALVVRRQLIGAMRDLRSRSDGRTAAFLRLRRPGAVVLAGALLLATLPVLGDMLNYEPDVRMRASEASGSVPPGNAAAGSQPVAVLPTPSGGTLPPPTGTATLSTLRPWLAWTPSGIGSATMLRVPAAWGPAGTTVPLAVYLPPDYGASNRRYPVLYETPWSETAWFHGVNLGVQMDSLTDSGAIPATIVVFLAQGSGPYPDSECVNSADGREWYDRWVVETVVPTIDQAFRTIANPAARGLFGYSHGGFCAAMLALRHPDVFSSAISFSGYYQAGIVTNQTTNAGLPFGGDAQLKAAYSPVDLAGQVPAIDRGRMLVELSASPSEVFYGPQYALIVRALRAAGIPMELYPTPLGHSWAAVRAQFAEAVRIWAEHLSAQNLWA